MTLHVFAGPTLTTQQIHTTTPDAIVHPPVQHGDLFGISPAPGDTVLIIDGLWHQVPPVRHKEILELLHRGVTIAGAASMGALRAAELAPYGMTGIGWVYDQYATGQIDADDEVALVHTAAGKPLSVALVCLRYTIREAQAAALITEEEARRLLTSSREIPFARRSWTALAHAASAAGLTNTWNKLTAWRRHHPSPAVRDIKAADARHALDLLATGQVNTTTYDQAWRREPWRTSHLRRWAATYEPVAELGDAQVPLLPALHHAQIYDPAFADRWRRRVLAWIASRPSDAPNLEDHALDSAHRRGLTPQTLTPQQADHWATLTEITGLCQRDLLLRILVRSARLDPTASIWPETPAEAADLIDLQAHAAAALNAWRTNQAVAATGQGRTTDHLDPARIRAHLAHQWNLATANERELTAAARDRGILNADAAIAQTRPFYLAARVS